MFRGAAMTDVSFGILVALLAGVVNGSFAVPTKRMTRWNWENIWAVWALVALFVAPWLFALITVPKLLGFYRGVNPSLLLLLIGLGLGVGLAQIFFCLALATAGLSIGFAVTVGISTAIGSLVPLVLLHALFTPKGLMVVVGVVLIVVGTAVCGLASHRKEKEHSDAERQALVMRGTSFGRGMVFCILAGVLSPLLNFALAFGTPFLARAAQLGVSPASQTNTIWPPVLTATLIPYLAYCNHLWRKNKSFRLYALAGTGSYWFMGAVMGLFWMGSLVLYGAASTRMAAMGPVLGWPLFMSTIIISANAWGFATGEWKTARRRTVFVMLAGVLFLVLGFCAVAVGSKLT